MDNTVRVQVSVAAPASPQGGLRNSSPSFRRAVCICTLRLLYASRKCKTFVRSSFFASLQNCRSLTHFHSAGAARAAVLQSEFRNSSPSFGELFAYTPCGSFTRRKNARRSFAPRFSLCRKTVAHYHSSAIHPLLGQSAYSDGAGQRGRKKAEHPLRFFVFCCFDAVTSWRCTRKAP